MPLRGPGQQRKSWRRGKERGEAIGGRETRRRTAAGLGVDGRMQFTFACYCWKANNITGCMWVYAYIYIYNGCVNACTCDCNNE